MTFLGVDVPLVGLLRFLLVFNGHVERRDKGSDGKRKLESFVLAKGRMWCLDRWLLSFGYIFSFVLFGVENGTVVLMG